MNRPLFTLDNRLALCAEFVRYGASVADIGTDHAYLPVWLTKTGKCPKAIAADVKAEPLGRGQKTIEKYYAEELVQTRLSNGLEKISQDEADDIIIAGMGGELIVKILDGCSFIKDGKKRLILQPMTRSFFLREYLFKNGFEILKERAAEADKKVYSVISAVYTGKARIPSYAEKYAGGLAPKDEPADRKYIEKEIKSLKRKAIGMEKNKNEKEYSELLQIINSLQALI